MYKVTNQPVEDGYLIVETLEEAKELWWHQQHCFPRIIKIEENGQEALLNIPENSDNFYIENRKGYRENA